MYILLLILCIKKIKDEREKINNKYITLTDNHIKII